MADQAPPLRYRPPVNGAEPPEVLLATLGRLHVHLQTLLQAALDKLQAMRTADTNALNEVTQREHQALQKVQRAEQERRAAVARLAQHLHVADPHAQPLSELVSGVREPVRSQIHAKISGLQALAQQLQEKNRVAALVAQELQNHVQSVFSAVLAPAQSMDGYGPQGERHPTGNRMIVDALG
jgi:flagellar biosynthesis/type III secretory pathway chaperone